MTDGTAGTAGLAPGNARLVQQAVSAASPTDHVDNFVQKYWVELPEHAFMRVCDRTMTKKAVGKSMKSMAYTEKSGLTPGWGGSDICLRDCGVVVRVNPGAGRVLADV
jgi:hypothetical protein